MTKVLNETDKLSFILTQYGLERVAEALADTTVEINLSKIKVGDANFEYYVPTLAEFSKPKSDLRHLIPGGSFYIIGKELLEDGLTISLHTIFPENLENCEIREIGIYETVNDVDYLFAVSTQQPLLKPLESLRYFIAVDYYAFLKAQNLADIYDQIIIDAENALVTEEDYNNLMSTILFSESNLMEQINGNSRVIGLNRARQLSEKITEIQTAFSYTSINNNLSILLNYINPENLFAYWVFNYGNKNTASNSITDISKNKRHLSTNKAISFLNKDYIGLAPLLDLSSPNYFYLDQGLAGTVFNKDAFLVQGNPSLLDGIMTGMTSSDYVETPEINLTSTSDWAITFNFTFEDGTEVITEETDRTQLLLQSSNSYTFETDLHITQTIEDDQVASTETNLIVKIGDGTSWINNLECTVQSGANQTIKVLFNDGVYTLQAYDSFTDSFITVDTFNSNTEINNALGNITIGQAPASTTYYIVTNIDLKIFSILIGDNQIFSGKTLYYYNDMTLLDSTRTSDISFTMGFLVKPMGNETRTLLARSNYSNNSHIFEINEKADKSLEILLFSDSNNYLKFTSDIDTIPDGAHSLIFSYSAVDKNIVAFVNNQEINIIKTEVGTYTHMNYNPTTIYGFTCIPNPTVWANSSTTPTVLYDASGDVIPTTEKYKIQNNKVYINNNLCSLNADKNKSSGEYFAWLYNDAPETYTIYTRTETINSPNIKLYSDIGVLNTNSNFSIIQEGSSYVVAYNNNAMHRPPAGTTPNPDKDPVTLYAYSYNQPEQSIWADQSSNPHILYEQNGDTYTGNRWRIEDGVVYLDNYEAEYTSSLNNSNLAALRITSYITGSSGSAEQLINSETGLVFVIKEGLSKAQIRALSLNLCSILGKNPCANSY